MWATRLKAGKNKHKNGWSQMKNNKWGTELVE